MQNQIETNLNLARKWRSKNFDEIVGQDLSIKILRNSLFLNQFFPVYLFSGQRGSGKTSTARIFSTAINCYNLSNFQKNPKEYNLPCFECASCISMKNLRHPDFIEMDAASNTGVDNVRNIIESSSFMPILGSRKIYLIDEAHMLSRSAFNAFLKLLEEPPASALFILATTDPEKIPDTVRSRCFQIFFNPIHLQSLQEHLKKICIAENIKFEDSGIEVICKQSEGSVRDAINLLEQVRFSTEVVTKESVYRILGYPSDEQLYGLVGLLLKKEELSIFLRYLDKINFSQTSYEYIFQKIVLLLRNLIFYKYGVTVEEFNPKLFAIDINLISQLWISRLLEMFLDNDIKFQKVSNKKAFLESIFIQILISSSEDKKKISITPITKDTPIIKEPLSTEKHLNDKWGLFLEKLNYIDDPLINSIFKQADIAKIDEETGQIDIYFDKKFSFLMELLEDTKKGWSIILEEIFGASVKLNAILKDNIITQSKPEMIKQPAPVISNVSQVKPQFRSYKNFGKNIDVSDKERWQLSNALLESFGGKLIEIEEGTDE